MSTNFIIKNKNNNYGKSFVQFTFISFLLFTAIFYRLKASDINICKDGKAQLIKDFQWVLDSLQNQFGFPGATAAYVLPDGTTGVVATGFADLESRTKMTPQSRMLSASIGKTFVGATVVVLSLEGVLILDAPLSQWLGKRQWYSRLANYNEITLRQLLTHSSGLPDHVYQEDFAKEVSQKWKEKSNPFSPEDLIRFILDLPPLFEAGNGWAYSDTGYILLGLAIEEATGKSVFDVITERFLLPLNFTMTTRSNSRFLENLSAGYMSKDNPFGLPIKTTNEYGEMLWHPGFEWTGGGFISNSEDLAKWGWTLYHGNALQYPYLDELLKAVSISQDSNGNQYGAGVAIYRDGPFGLVYGHNGWIPGYCSSLRYYPDYGISIAFQINTDIGIFDRTTNVINEFENKLARIVVTSNTKWIQ